jgi:hypothetical protein
MLISATLKNRPHECWVAKLISKYKDLVIRIIDVKSDNQNGGLRQLFEITAPSELIEKIAKEIKHDDTLRDVKLVISKTGRIYGSVKVTHLLPCGLAETSDCFLRAITTNIGGEVEWHVVGKASSYKRLMNRLQEKGMDVKISSLHRVKNDRMLTGRQEVIVKTALDLGYFDCPKNISIEELAEMLDITPATLSEILRKGIKKILKEYYSQNDFMSTYPCAFHNMRVNLSKRRTNSKAKDLSYNELPAR